MKSNSDVYLLYKYAHGASFSMNDTLAGIINDHQQTVLDDYNLWIEDDSWKSLPRDKFDVTFLNLDANGNVSAIEFTERK